MTDKDHEAMLAALNSSHSMILLSGYDCDLYRDTSRGWRREQIQTTAEKKAARRTECLWINPAA